MKKNGRLLILTISTLFILSAIGLSVYYRNNLDLKKENSLEESVKGSDFLGEYPKIENVPPSTAYVGVPYSFVPLAFVKGDRGGLSYELITAPDWLFLYEDRLFGLPSVGDTGDEKVVLRVYNGNIYMDYVYYIQVNEKEDLDNN